MFDIVVFRPRSASDGHALSGLKKVDLEKMFNRMIDREWEERSTSQRTSRRQSAIAITTPLISNTDHAEKSKEEKEIGKMDSEGNTLPMTSSSVVLCLLPPPNDPSTSLIPPMSSPAIGNSTEPHLFKKLLVACCDSCERRASLVRKDKLS